MKGNASNMNKLKEDSLRIQFKSGELIDVAWLKNHAHLTQDEIDRLVDEGVLTRIAKDPVDTMSDDKYLLN